MNIPHVGDVVSRKGKAQINDGVTSVKVPFMDATFNDDTQ